MCAKMVMQCCLTCSSEITLITFEWSFGCVILPDMIFENFFVNCLVIALIAFEIFFVPQFMLTQTRLMF